MTEASPSPEDPWKGANPLDAGFRDDPYPALAHLRETDPVHAMPLGYRVLRYADVWRVLREVPSGVRPSDGRGQDHFVREDGTGDDFMLSHDPPTHTRLRKLVSKAFTPRAIERLRPRVQEVADAQIDRALERGTMDVIAELALPVPATMICEMMGIPAEDRDRFTQWTADSTHLLAADFAPPDVVERGLAASNALDSYFRTLVAERRLAPTDDILTHLVQAEESGDRLSPSELLSQAAGLLVAGFETTIGLIGNGVRALIEHPEQLARLRADPDLIGSAVEECLRYDGPILLTVRFVHDDVEVGGVKIPKDSQVWTMLASANRDPARFDAPEVFDIARDPNPHLAFGGGVHFCLGAHLARMEAQVAIGTLVRRTRTLELASEERVWGASLFRVPGELPVRLSA